MGMTKILIARLNEEQHKTAFALARAKGMSISTLVRHLILSEVERRNVQKNSSAEVRQDKIGTATLDLSTAQ